jgi:hypothetical protein
MLLSCPTCSNSLIGHSVPIAYRMRQRRDLVCHAISIWDTSTTVRIMIHHTSTLMLVRCGFQWAHPDPGVQSYVAVWTRAANTG